MSYVFHKATKSHLSWSEENVYQVCNSEKDKENDPQCIEYIHPRC